MKIDYNRDQLLTEFGRATLLDRYLLPEEKSPQDAFARAAKAFSTDEAHAQRIYDYASKLWFMFSTPILSNGLFFLPRQNSQPNAESQFPIPQFFP